jgi:hypothetical protein
MGLNISQLAKDMSGAFVGTLQDKAPDIRNYATSEAKKLAQTFVQIEKLVLLGKIDKEEAQLHLEIQKNAARMVFLAIEGLGMLAVEQAINAAFEVVRKTVNTAIGFKLV